MAIGRRKVAEEQTDIDMTPMLDVVFILLIFFVVTASFVREAGIDINRPPISDEPPPDSQPTAIIFRIAEDNTVWLEGRRIDVRSVRANVERAHAENPQTKVIIEAHPQAKTETFVLISDQAREAGVYDIALGTKK
ncbi:MAG: biopolymer transporter ExbD [Porticoccus sp.]|jgi:biopolymer transport protein ExbD|uniref:ExbD/TolR family protein n=1 Tax=Porticoccus hydrocarbonoclasticus TaxID=1073414 RepID=UPI000563D7F8|nr:biopolymer transporter ExbD [Porticoccus hydrocarbonoclasticus]MBG58423.1 biopolymer transporter ExbD [Porticoccus sp.]|tara:strand:- start:12139 stop:12546 length:408 start_codon:yes stop_codon:yes gene_type:complete